MTSSRRRFLKQGLFASAGSAFPPVLSQGSRRGCGLAYSTYGLPTLSLEEAIALIASTGYNAVEIAALPGTSGAPSQLSRRDRQRIRQRLADEGLRLCALMADLHPQSLATAHEAQLVELYHLIQLGHELSPDQPPVIQTVLGGKNWEESRDCFRDRIADWVQVAADQRAYLSIKPHRSHAMSLPSQANWLIAQLGSPERLGLTFDYSHYAHREPELSVEAAVKEALPKTNYVAVKDSQREGNKVRFALPGECGTIDHGAILAALYDGGYRGDFCCEISSQIWKGRPDYDPVGTAQRCFATLSPLFERLGIARR